MLNRLINKVVRVSRSMMFTILLDQEMNSRAPPSSKRLLLSTNCYCLIDDTITSSTPYNSITPKRQPKHSSQTLQAPIKIQVKVKMSVVHTPSKSNDSKDNVITLENMESTFVDTSQVTGQLDVIASNVNQTIQDLNQIYREIGYSAPEISMKKSEIFTVLQESIFNFTTSLQREKSNIENECEWLRQQIRIILAMVNDSNGEKYLSDMNKGLVFKNWNLFEQGFKAEIRKKLSIFQTRREHFYEDSPFNISTVASDNDRSFEKQYEQMLTQTPQLSLINLKTRLNNIFLDTLKHFIKSFKKLNGLVLQYWELLETLGDMGDYSNDFDKSLPTKLEALLHKQLIDQFESTMKCLRLSDAKFSTTASFLNEPETDTNQMAFIISSPRKSKLPPNPPPEDQDVGCESPKNVDDLMNYLRDVNYQIVKVIRGLRFTKISSLFFTDLSNRIDYCLMELETRQKKMNSIITECFELIDVLCYNEDQLINLQKQFTNTNDTPNTEGFFDKETLKFIQSNPKEFGLNQSHLKFIETFLNLLVKVKSSKEKKLKYYLENCHTLWEKLNENSDYIDNFISINNNLSDNSLTNFKMELNRLFSKRSEFIDKFIIDTRKEIDTLWDTMFYTQDQKNTFKYYDYTTKDDDYDQSFDKEMILNEHEQELASLKQEYVEKEPILTKFANLKQLIKDQEFLNESSKDSSRLLSKNSCKILLNEERLRKKILKNMPKLINDLKQLVIAYNNTRLDEGKKPFLIYNDDFFEKLLLIENQQHNKKTQAKSESPTKTRPKTSPAKSTRPKVSPNKSVTRPKSLRRQSPIITNPIRKPVRLTRTNPSQSSQKSQSNDRMKHAINSSINESNDRMKHAINSSITESNASPYMASSLRGNTSSMRPAALQPLNSPLLPSTRSSNIARSSNYFSPNKFEDPSSPMSDKENDVTFQDMKLGLTPIKVSDLSKWDKRDTSTPTSEPGINFDSDTIDGDEYHQWRVDRLNQINGPLTGM